MDSFWENRKKIEKWLFFGHFWAKFGYVSHIPAIRFWCHCTYRTIIWCRMTVENFVQIVWTVFEKIEKKSKNDCFLAIFGLILAMFLTSQPYDFDGFAQAGALLGVEWLCKISWKSYGQFLRNLKFSWKGREKKNKKKQHDCISSRKFFPTPKKYILTNICAFKIILFVNKVLNFLNFSANPFDRSTYYVITYSTCCKGWFDPSEIV